MVSRRKRRFGAASAALNASSFFACRQQRSFPKYTAENLVQMMRFLKDEHVSLDMPATSFLIMHSLAVKQAEEEAKARKNKQQARKTDMRTNRGRV